MKDALGKGVSIHAPTRGATLPSGWQYRARWFRSTPPREGRRERAYFVFGDRVVSIHAPTRGATLPPPAWNLTSGTSFDPRPHARGDSCLRQPCTARMIRVEFRSTPPREGRRVNRALTFGNPGMGLCFDPRPHARGDMGAMRALTHCTQGWFRSTPPREGRPGAKLAPSSRALR